jgi:hypothetical protein
MTKKKTFDEILVTREELSQIWLRGNDLKEVMREYRAILQLKGISYRRNLSISTRFDPVDKNLYVKNFVPVKKEEEEEENEPDI